MDPDRTRNSNLSDWKIIYVLRKILEAEPLKDEEDEHGGKKPNLQLVLLEVW